MTLRLGIGITTFNREQRLRETLDKLARYTVAPHELMVADDGSGDGTLDLLRRGRVPHLHGPNRGVAWNKNRLLYYFHAVARCDVVLLLEDDTQPLAPGWEAPWIEAALRHGHANVAGAWFQERFVGGSGTPADPYRSPIVSGQCSVFSRAALDAAGYMDTRFGRYGYEHCDHSQRLVRSGYGGEPGASELFYLVASDIEVRDLDAFTHAASLADGLAVYAELRADPSLFRWPWRSHREMRALLAEIRSGRYHDTRRKLRAVARTRAIRAAWIARRLWRRLSLGAASA